MSVVKNLAGGQKVNFKIWLWRIKICVALVTLNNGVALKAKGVKIVILK